MPWDFEPNPPYRVLSTTGNNLFDIEDLTEAIDEFVRWCIPPLKGTVSAVFDADGVLVIGYDLDDMEGWRGLKLAFDAMSCHRAVIKTHVELWAIEAQVER
jgi:hypothetical protein